MDRRGDPNLSDFREKIIKLELRSRFDLRGACKLNKNKILPWGQSVPLINWLNSASTVLQWVSSGFGTRRHNWKLPNATGHLPAAKQPPEGWGGWHRCVWGDGGRKGQKLVVGRGGMGLPSPHPCGDLPSLQRAWAPAKKTAFVFP